MDIYYDFYSVQALVTATTPSAALDYANVDSTNTSELRPIFNDQSYFAQDSWQITHKLTLNYGLRWDYDPPPAEISGHPFYTALNLKDPANVQLAPAGTPLWHASKTNFAPRFGFSYEVHQSPGFETVVRGGGGIFYGLGDGQGAQGTLGTPYSRTNYFYGSQGYSYPLTPAQAAPIPITLNPPYSYVFAFDPNLKDPRIYMWNGCLQQDLGSSRSIRMSYVGNVGRNLLRNEMLEPDMGGNPNFQYLDVTTNADYSNYNALQLEYKQQLWKHLQILATYTWAHSLDNGSGVAVPTPYYTVYAPSSDYGASDFDVRNTFTNAISYELPGTRQGNSLLHYVTNGWAFDSLFRSNSADPINITTGLYTFGLVWNGAAIDQRPNVVPNQPVWISSPGTAGGKIINAAAFSAPATTFTQGNLQRNAVRGFNVWQEDIALRREFPIHDSVSLLFRAEAFNVFNHPLFGDVGVNDGRNLVFSGDKLAADGVTITGTTPNPYFGISSETLASSLGGGGADGGFSSLYQIGAPRSLQFALKLRF